jgi:hypothetical protein
LKNGKLRQGVRFVLRFLGHGTNVAGDAKYFPAEDEKCGKSRVWSDNFGF